NCIAMFVVFVVAVLFLTPLVVAVFGARLAGSGPAVTTVNFSCASLLIIPCGVFAAIYLPLRWQAIMQLPAVPRALGLIGFFGLIGLLTAMLVCLLA
ncbi:MAG: hypothetical protein HQ546_03590, partial [Planctomycetes bacterium]|nr:hypothetical protein [Planctomycetota bacterium]